jgi:hypothetical protein
MLWRSDADHVVILSIKTYSSALNLRIKQKYKCNMHAYVILYALSLSLNFEIDV